MAHIFILMSCLICTHGYTIDPDPILHLRSKESNSLFGYDLTSLHLNNNSTRILIGAARSSRPGVFYDCGLDNGQCEFRMLDFTDMTAFSVTQLNMSDAWFGSQILAIRNSSFIMCSPRLKHVFNLNESNSASIRLNEQDMPGVCHLVTITTSGSLRSQIIKFPGLFDWNLQNFNKEGFGLFGSSLSLSTKQNLIVGVPGSYYFRGQIYVIPIGSPSITNNVVLRKKKWLKVPEKESDDFSDDWCYRGYAVGSLDLTETKKEGILASVPRLNNYTGILEIYNESLSLRSILRGHQVGSYFGFSLATVDINGDGLTDIIIGSPYYSSKDDELYDCGRADVYHQNKLGEFTHSKSIIGASTRGRFGFSVSAIGDLNLDGYEDIAISQPFGDSPSVQIYFGSTSGLQKDAKQQHCLRKISLNECTLLSVSNESLEQNFHVKVIKSPEGSEWFGSVVKAIKNDTESTVIAISSISSDTVHVYRTRPIVSIEKGVIFTPNYVSTHTDRFNITISLNSTAYLDFNLISSPRLFFKSGRSIQNYTINLAKEELYCFALQAVKRDILDDKLTPVKFYFNYTLANESLAVLNQSQTNKLEIEVPIEKSCGSDGICIPNLSIKINSEFKDKEYSYSARKPFGLSIQVDNAGEDAFESRCSMRMPAFLQLARINTSLHDSTWCEFNGYKSHSMLSCELGNPLQSNESRLIQLQLQPIPSEMNEIMRFEANVSSKNAELAKTLNDNFDVFKIPVHINAGLSLVGHTEYDQIYANKSRALNYSNNVKSVQEIGPTVVHIYRVQNSGTIPFEKIGLDVSWPSHTRDGKNHLLYLSEPPELSRLGESIDKDDFCTVTTNLRNAAAVNPLGIKVKKRSTTVNPSKYRTFINCEIGNLEPNHNVILVIRSRLWENSILTIPSSVISIKSECQARVMLLPLNFTRKIASKSLMNRSSIETVVYTESKSTLNAMPDMWVIVIATSAGLLFLALLSIFLWCCGFFERIRAPRCQRYQIMTVKDDEPIKYRYVHNDENNCILRAYERQSTLQNGKQTVCSISANSTIL